MLKIRKLSMQKSNNKRSCKFSKNRKR